MTRSTTTTTIVMLISSRREGQSTRLSSTQTSLRYAKIRLKIAGDRRAPPARSRTAGRRPAAEPFPDR